MTTYPQPPFPVNKVDSDNASVDEAVNASPMRALPSIAQIVADVELSTDPEEAQKRFARELLRMSVGLVARYEGDWRAAKLARDLAKERVNTV